MKSFIKNSIFKGILAFALLFNLTGCELDEVNNPNGPSVDELINNASQSDLNALVSGTESLMRFDLGFYYDAVGVVGREYWRFTAADPRYTADLLGAAPLDNNTFYTTRSFAGRYRCVRNTNILLQAIENTKASLTEEQKNGYRGFAKTIQAYQLLLNLNQQYANGIRTDVSDPDNLGPFTDYNGGLTFIHGLLEEAFNELANAGSSFAFNLSSGFAGFNNPTTLNQFNQALAARVALYRGDYLGAEDHLNKSFFDLAGGFDTGVYHFFSTSGGDVINPISLPPGTKDALVAHPSFVAALQPGDDRAGKIASRDPYTLDNLTADYDVVRYTSQSSPVPIIRNEELILIYVEIAIEGGNLTDAKDALDVIRTGHGLAPYSGIGTADALTNELLTQRFLSLFQEGHRWVDMRRFGRLGDLPVDRAGDLVWPEFPRPASEG